MRISFAVRTAPPFPGGIETSLRLAASGLAAQGDDVTVLAQDIDQPPTPWHADRLVHRRTFRRFERWGYTTEPLGVRGLRVPVALAAYARERARRRGAPLDADDHRLYARALGGEMAARSRSADVLHSMHGGNLAAAGLFAARRLGIPFVVSPHAHAGQWDDTPSAARTYREADVVVAASETDARLYRSLGVSDGAVRLLHPCVERPPDRSSVDVRRRHGIDGPIVLFVGRRAPYKGLDLLLAAAPSISSAFGGGAVIVVIGPGEGVDDPPPCVLDVGAVDDEEKFAWLRAADLVCLPSAYESFGLVVAEAWSVGTPVLTSRAPALSELVEKGGGGHATERSAEAIADGVIAMLRDRDGLERLGAAGRSYWERELSTEGTVAGLSEIYRSLLP